MTTSVYNAPKADVETATEEFARNGFAIIRGALSPEEMGLIQEQWLRVRTPLVEGQTIDGIRRDNFYIHGKLPSPVGDVYRHPLVVELAQRLVGPDVALYINRLNVKDAAFRDPIHLHQDLPYFNGGNKKVMMFVALQDINLNNGAMVFVPRSQELGLLDRKTIDISKHPELDVIIPSLSPGDLIICDILLWHSSVPNTVGTDRVLLQMIFQPADDGSYYPPSVPEPDLVVGEWRTTEFTPWQVIRSETAPMQLDSTPTSTGEATTPTDAVATAAETPTSQSAPDVVGAAVEAAASTTAANPDVLTARLPEGFDWKREVKALLPPRLKNFIKRRLNYPMPSPVVVVPQEIGVTPPTPELGTQISAGVLPRFFTPSTGPEQVRSLPESAVDWVKELGPTAEYLKARGKVRVLAAFRTLPSPEVIAAAENCGLCVQGYLQLYAENECKISSPDGKPIYRPQDLRTLSTVDAVVVFCSQGFGAAVRQCESYLFDGLLFVPAAREAIVPQRVRDCTPSEWFDRSSILSYLQRSGMRGHFAEFGTYWGRSFFSSYYELNHWLHGNFFAFDSFAGLPEPDPREQNFTNGDLKKGAYGCNHESFAAMAEILGLPSRRLSIVPGSFSRMLKPQTAIQFRLTPKSLSVCRIASELLEPTREVLDFVSPLLDDGALVCFEDWRSCRADSNVGERGAAMRWLESNPSFELVDFHNNHWQHQWFIFHRNRSVKPSLRRVG